MSTQIAAGSLPEAFLEQMKSLLGEADFFQYLKTLEEPAKKGMRLNPMKCPVDKTERFKSECAYLAEMMSRMTDGISERQMESILKPVPWAEHGYYYEDPLHPGQLPLHEAGMYYIQEPSAMSAAALLDPKPGEKVLDLFEAPGGKSTQIASMMRGRGLLVSNEPVPGRARVLSSNMERMGVRNSLVVCELPERLSPLFQAFFDRILVDATCSGEVMFRKTQESRSEWNAGSPIQCAARQMDILEQAAVMLKPGGILVYSTCTFNAVENEGVIEQFTGKHQEFEMVPFELPGLGNAPGGMMHLYPHRIDGEGHFLAKLIKCSDDTCSTEKKEAVSRNRKKGQICPALPDIYKENCFAEERLTVRNEILWYMPDGINPGQLDGVRMLRSGIALCSLHGRQPEPDHAAGMALTSLEVKNVCELSVSELKQYQAGETVRKTCDRGWVMLQYEGISVGWGKQSDGVIKIHYPKGLRGRAGN